MHVGRFSPHKTNWILAAGLGVILSACAGDFLGPRVTTLSNNAFQLQTQQADSLMSGRVTFRYNDYYSITSPDPNTSCAGDAKAFYDPLALDASGNPLKLATSLFDNSTTIRPGFIKNVSVDLTDSNAAVAGNLAQSCSYGTGPNSPAVSNCATFDYGAENGIPTTMGGSLLLVGGIFGYNYTGYLPTAVQANFPFHTYTVSCGPTKPASMLVPPTGFNACNASVYALGVDTLPASAATTPPNSLVPGLESATAPISSWSNISGTPGYSGPKGVAGGAAAYDPGTQDLIIFGGASPLGAIIPTGAGVTTYDTWSFNLKKQQWSLLNSNVYVDVSIVGMFDFNGVSFLNLSKPEGARSLFGYAPAQGMALQSMSTAGATVAPIAAGLPNPASNVDLTDRIMIAGGVSATGGLSDIHRFNPTYGPDWVDTLGFNNSITGNPPLTAPVQWLDSYHTQLVNNSYSYNGATYRTDSSQYSPNYPSLGAEFTKRSLADSFGMVGIRNNNAATGAGYLLFAGGFDSTVLQNIPANGCADLNHCGGMVLNAKRGPEAAAESDTANYIGIPNLISIYSEFTPQQSTDILDGGRGSVPWYGGVSMVPGFNMQTNDVVYFGGADCAKYLNDATSTCASFANPGRYWQLTTDPNADLTAGAPGAPTDTGFSGTTAPKRAGMAVARGQDPSGNVIIVAWGGMIAAATATDQAVYYLFNAAALPAVAPTWANFTPVGVAPAVYGNAALVFSHVTKKFYLFGGYNPLANFTSPDTWELTVSGANCGLIGNCQFSWRQLDVAGGLTCYPTTCPSARRSHRMVEANYYNRNPGGVVTVNGEPNCSASSNPCSFGIFMEGGTPDGVNVIADRWLFDPTANGGNGNWQKMGDMPPRTLAAISSVDYTVASTNNPVHRAILFGGETGLHSLGYPPGITNYFVAPTLGDTYMYDFDAQTWNRVNLVGKGYAIGTPLGSVPADSVTGVTEFEARQAYSATDATAHSRELAELSPPPLSGAIMVTRTLSAPTLNAKTPVAPLKIPEVYLFGGRTKDGHYFTLNHVYKFCAGSTGEKPFNVDAGNVPRSPSGAAMTGPDDASCDAYDSVTNANSMSPESGYVGRWLRKNPVGAAGITVSDLSSFLGAGAYDPIHDKILLVGGMRKTLAGASVAVTDTVNSSAATNPGVDPSVYVYEYTPPSSSNPASAQAATDGTWTFMRNCSGFPLPVGRYAHSAAYDPLNQQILLVGGYDTTGAPLTQTETYYDGRIYAIPEVWAAKRIDSTNAPPGFPAQVPPLSPTAPCYYWVQKTTFGNSIDIATQAPPMTGFGNAAAVFIPSSGYNTGYYTTLDQSCIGSGPITSGDATINKLLAGGAYIDVDRSQLGPNENLVLNITFLPLGNTNQNPDSSLMTPAENAYFRIHLVKTGQTGDQIRQIFQPRFLTYSSTNTYPEAAQTIDVLAPPTGQITQQQVFIPISIDPAIDRIRIERYSGSAILIDASLFRMGYR